MFSRLVNPVILVQATGEADANRFLIYDSGPTEQKQMLVFASKKQLRHLAASDQYVDVLLSRISIMSSTCRNQIKFSIIIII